MPESVAQRREETHKLSHCKLTYKLSFPDTYGLHGPRGPSSYVAIPRMRLVLPACTLQRGWGFNPASLYPSELRKFNSG
jgi:hypothetical protein